MGRFSNNKSLDNEYGKYLLAVAAVYFGFGVVFFALLYLSLEWGSAANCGALDWRGAVGVVLLIAWVCWFVYAADKGKWIFKRLNDRECSLQRRRYVEELKEAVQKGERILDSKGRELEVRDGKLLPKGENNANG